MSHILSHQHICLPVWTSDSSDRQTFAPDLLVHVQVTVIRMRYRSVFEEQEDTERERLRRWQRDERRSDADEKTSPKKTIADTAKKTRFKSAKKTMRRPVIDDPRVNDPKFREKYQWN
ncbi:MAG TPA: hypothetical protein VHA78_05870 [Candidatus Peribacteraceae bacterium]|nr:hypothetical protein [Candidatus Peribacteraceae bacterium]